MKNSDFPSTRDYHLGPTYPRLAVFYWQSNTFTRTAWRESHQKSLSAWRAETCYRFQYDLPENQIWHTDDSDLSQKEKAIFFLCRSSFFGVSSAIADITRVFGDKSIVFLHLPRKFRADQLGLLSINFAFRDVIFQHMVFPFVWAKYKWKFMRDRCKLSLTRPLAASRRSRGSLRSPK